ncbi:MAG: glycerol-3-phosphate 1-O-acyltransferase PlsY [Bradyrhizobiaceae bacterium]|nr:glycerol-3-phosphate 1-O-acyltransferase PlsY [Bradyrhizobiaceae bacterium]
MLEPIYLLWLFAALVFGYLLGSIPFGIVLTRLAGMGDIRAIGSGNIGATNVLRTGNKPLAAATLLGDMLKGTVAVIVADRFLGRDFALAAGLGAFLGHLFPVWLEFRGGKGVATFLGVLLGLFWPAAIAFAAIWLAVAGLTRYSSLSALVASAVSPFVLYGFGLPLSATLIAALAVLLWIKHADNIQRLFAGTEGRIGEKKSGG